MGNKLTGTDEFKDKMKDVNDMLKDPAKAAEMEAKMEHMLKVGAEQMKQNSGIMDDALKSMNDPTVLKQVTEMMKDPKFQQQISQMAKDPSFKGYIDSMQEMMKDPNKKAQME